MSRYGLKCFIFHIHISGTRKTVSSDRKNLQYTECQTQVNEERQCAPTICQLPTRSHYFIQRGMFKCSNIFSRVKIDICIERMILGYGNDTVCYFNLCHSL